MKAESYQSYEVEVTREDVIAYVRDRYGLRVPDDAHIGSELRNQGRTDLGALTITWETKPEPIEEPPRCAR